MELFLQDWISKVTIPEKRIAKASLDHLAVFPAQLTADGNRKPLRSISDCEWAFSVIRKLKIPKILLESEFKKNNTEAEGEGLLNEVAEWHNGCLHGRLHEGVYVRVG